MTIPSTARFTKGPWEVVTHERFPFQREVKGEDGYVCDMEGLSEDDMVTVEANARLIAAAPDLYEALKDADDTLANLGISEVMLGRRSIRAALAKAVQP